ncbi:MAG: hypothetical protein AUJ01_14665 [Acidobacteria bacterium 13_1_40CM_3_65_5]|nr:MAG: hypothetical protein AUJ01_14665 [Acidobacteria bacterium 13_1_40CM_3_65_5]
MMTALIVAAFLSGSQTPTQQIPQQPTQLPPTVAAPRMPPAPQPAVSRPPAEQQPAPTPTPTTPDAAAPTVRQADPDRKTALMLLDRIGSLIDEALEGTSGTSGTSGKSDKSSSKAVGTSGRLVEKAGKVTVDRAALDEIRAEVAQIKLMLQR